MQNRLLGLCIALTIALTPAFADTSNSSNLSVSPSNTLAVNPTTNSSASTSNISTQINNNNLGADSYGPGITCQSPQVALGGFGERSSAGFGAANSASGVTVQYLTPVGQTASRACQALAHEIVHQKTLDTQLTLIQRCADFIRAGIILDPHVYPELAQSCAGIHLISTPAATAPVQAYPRSNSLNTPQNPQRVSLNVTLAVVPAQQRKVHLSDFSPEHNSELQRIALRRITSLSYYQYARQAQHLPAKVRLALNEHINHENMRLRALIAEYQLENAFLHNIAADRHWHATQSNQSLRDRILSYEATQHNS